MSLTSQPNSLSDIVSKHDFIDNPLDVYENYTYNLELLVVDRNADRKFQQMEAHRANQIVTNSWPGPEDNSITIAKTGVTTEFNITDLEVLSNSVGNSNNSKIAGTAISLNFTITQIGNTNLVDNLQNTIALCGYPSIPNATFYMKINFQGYDESGSETILPFTKVLPFTIKDYADLQTVTDSKGTSTLITGVIITDEVITNVYLSKIENGFTYDVGDTLEDTLKNFTKKLNSTLKNTHPTLDKSLQNVYSIEASDQFKEKKYFASAMKGLADITTQSTTKTSKNKAQQIGTVTPLMSIYNIVENICLNAIEVKKELVKSKSTTTNVLKITPYIVPRTNGYNAVKGTSVYEIQYYIDFEKKPVIHNKMDQLDKAKASKQITEEYFQNNHVNKIYNYLFTGKNDQILDFTISLDRQLAKIYTTPHDSYAYEHFLVPTKTYSSHHGETTNYQAKISEEHQQYIDAAKDEVAKLKKREKASKVPYESLKTRFVEYKDDMRTQIVNQIGMVSGGPPSVLSDMVAGKSLEDLVVMGENGEFGDLWTEENSKTYKIYQDDIEKLRKKYGTNTKASRAAKDKLDTYWEDAFATQLSLTMLDSVDTSNKIFDKLNLNQKSRKNQKTMILTENLNDDIISTLSNEDFEVILKSQTNNPIIFEKVISSLADPGGTKIDTLKSTDPDSVNMAREKYYESKQNNISMINASMTIKGDPFWIEGYMSPEVAKDQFGNSGTTTDKGLNVHTTMNGPNGCVIVSGIADGVDLNDNILTRNLITSLYVVTNITSTFSGGRFQQTLTMRKNIEAEYMVSTPAKIGPEFEGESFDLISLEPKKVVYPYASVSGSGSTADRGEYLAEVFGPRFDTVAHLISAGNFGATTAGGTTGNLVGAMSNFDDNGFFMGVPGSPERIKYDADKAAKKAAKIQELFESRMETVMSEYRPRNAISVEPDPTPVGDAKIKLANETNVNADTVVELHENTEPGKLELGGGPALRQAAAGMYLNSLPGLTRACKSEQKRGVIPFVACDAIEAHNKKVLKLFETTPGVPPTTAEINAHLNNDIADAHPSDAGLVSDSASTIGYGVITDADGGSGSIVRDRGSITSVAGKNNEFSELEIAQFQIAHGAVLSVDGHDPADIERLVRKYSLAKTPVAIVEEQKAGIVATDISSPDTGAIMNNAILEGNQTFIAKAAPETRINVPPTPPMTEAEYEAKWEAIRDDTDCVGQCRSAKIIMLGKEYNDAVKEQYYIDKANEAIIEEAESKGGWFSNAWTKTLKVIGFGADTYTESEHSDRVVLSEGINDILATTTLTSDQVAKKEALIRSSVVILDDKIKNDGLIISDVERSATVGAIITEISNEATLNAVSEVDYAKIKAYETAVNNIVVNASSGDRADLGVAVHVGKTQGEIAVLSAKHDAIIAKDYYFDPAHRAADALLQVQLENDLALLALTQPEEVTTKIATIETAGIDTYINIKNPVEVLAVNQTPLVVRNALSTYDIILPGTLSEKLAAVGGDMSMLSQYSEANKIYKLITKMDGAVMKVVTDDAGQKIKIKDFGAIGLITYRDANGVDQTIDPVTLFNLHTTTYEDMNPTYARDYNAIKKKIATLFPNIDTVDKNLTVKAGGLVNADGIPTSIMYDSFYVNP